VDGNSSDGRGHFRDRSNEAARQKRVEALETGRGERAKRRHRLARQHGDIESLGPWRRRGVCLPQIDWNAASEESSPQCEDRSANVPRQEDLNHEEIFSAIRLAIYHIFQDRQHLNNSLLNQNIFFYFGRYDSDIIHGMHRGLPDEMLAAIRDKDNVTPGVRIICAARAR
jgi:hypothetical protein